MDDGREGEGGRERVEKEREEIKISRTTRQVTLSSLFLILIILPLLYRPFLPSLLIHSCCCLSRVVWEREKREEGREEGVRGRDAKGGGVSSAVEEEEGKEGRRRRRGWECQTDRHHSSTSSLCLREKGQRRRVSFYYPSTSPCLLFPFSFRQFDILPDSIPSLSLSLLSLTHPLSAPLPPRFIVYFLSLSIGSLNR